MKNDFYINLIYKEITGEISQDEKNLLSDFLNSSSENQELYWDIKLSWELSDQTLNLNDLNIESDLDSLKKKLPNQPKTKPEAKIVSIRRRIYQVGAAVFLLVAVGFLFRNFSKPSNSNIELFAQQANLPFELPDGSKGTLRQGSKLIYQTSFAENRKSTLIGTANFDVIRDTKRPFKVHIEDAVVEVLGTSFSIDQVDERLTVSVSSGQVSLTQNNESIILNKDEAGFCNAKNGSPIKATTYSDNFLYWERKQFRFEKQSLQSIIRELELIYGIDVEITNSVMNQCQLSGVFNGDNPTSILKTIASKIEMKVKTISIKSYKLDEGRCN